LIVEIDCGQHDPLSEREATRTRFPKGEAYAQRGAQLGHKLPRLLPGVAVATPLSPVANRRASATQDRKGSSNQSRAKSGKVAVRCQDRLP